jgi:hypothetical protein
VLRGLRYEQGVLRVPSKYAQESGLGCLFMAEDFETFCTVVDK